MTKSCNIIFHTRNQKEKLRSHSITVAVNDEKEDIDETSLPNEDRVSTYDAVKFNEIINWLSQQLFLRNKESQLELEIHTLDIHLKILHYLRYSYSYRGYQFFNAEYAEKGANYIMYCYQINQSATLLSYQIKCFLD